MEVVDGGVDSTQVGADRLEPTINAIVAPGNGSSQGQNLESSNVRRTGMLHTWAGALRLLVLVRTLRIC